jgi:ATP-dependent Clp protease ATP-binding subunit ClpC
MEKHTFVFTKDYLDVIGSAWMFTAHHNEKVIQPDDMVLWVYAYVKKQPYGNTFWSFLGIPNHAFLQKITDSWYPQLGNRLPQWRMQLKLDDAFQKGFLHFKGQGVKKLNFLMLLWIAMGNLSPELTQAFGVAWFTIEWILSRITKAIALTDAGDSNVNETFMMVHQMVEKMWIDLADADLMVDMAKMSSDDLKSQFADAAHAHNKEDDLHVVDSSSDRDEKKLTIEYYGTDLMAEAKGWFLDPVIGREKEIDQMTYTLLRKTKNNPLLIGEAGVWKTALVEWLAQRILAGTVPEKLHNKRIMMLDMWSLLAGTKYRWEFESRLKTILEEVTDPTNNIILFIDEIHTIIGAWNSEWSADAANMLKPLLSRGKMQLIGATTFDEYQKHIEKDPALKRRFQELTVNEPSVPDAITILQGIQGKFEDFHGVNIDQEAIQKAVEYSVRYIMNKHLPDKAIDLIDEASARLSTLQQKLKENSAYTKKEKEIATIKKKIEKAIEKQDYFRAAELKEQEEACKKQLSTMRKQHVLPKDLRPTVTYMDVGRVLSEKMGIPLDQVTATELHKLVSLDTHLKQKIRGQDEAVDQIVRALRRSRLSVVEYSKPIGSFLFLGPSGVGKTYLAKLLAKEYFADEKSLIRVDMSEFMERHSSSKLIGSAPGYVGYEEWWILTEQVRRKPYSVVLFDEIEKASPDVLNILLQVLDEGHLKDNKGRWIDFKNTIIILTSNIGSSEFSKSVARIWFASSSEWDHKHADMDFKAIKDRVLEQTKDHLKPELLNRLTGTVVFKPLSRDVMADLLQIKLKEFAQSWASKPHVRFPTFTKKKITSIIETIYDPQYGARPLERYIIDEVEPWLIDQLLAHWV